MNIFTFLFENKTLQDTENSPTTSANLKSDKANFTPQETQGTTKSSKGCSPPGHAPPVTTSDTKDGGKEKAGPTSLPLGKLFWKKVSLCVVCNGPRGGSGSGVISCGPADVDDSRVIFSVIQLVTEWRAANVLLGGKSRRSVLYTGALWGRNRDKQATVSFFEWPGSVTEAVVCRGYIVLCGGR